MGTNTIDSSFGEGDVGRASQVNQYATALDGDIIPRRAGVPSDEGGSLGQPSLKWSNGFFSTLTVGGLSVDPTSFETQLESNRIVGGRVRDSISGLPSYLSLTGVNDQVTVLGQDVNLSFVVNGVVATINTDISVTGLAAAPSVNNEAQVNLSLIHI